MLTMFFMRAPSSLVTTANFWKARPISSSSSSRSIVVWPILSRAFDSSVSRFAWPEKNTSWKLWIQHFVNKCGPVESCTDVGQLYLGQEISWFFELKSLKRHTRFCGFVKHNTCWPEVVRRASTHLSPTVGCPSQTSSAWGDHLCPEPEPEIGTKLSTSGASELCSGYNQASPVLRLDNTKQQNIGTVRHVVTKIMFSNGAFVQRRGIIQCSVYSIQCLYSVNLGPWQLNSLGTVPWSAGPATACTALDCTRRSCIPSYCTQMARSSTYRYFWCEGEFQGSCKFAGNQYSEE